MFKYIPNVKFHVLAEGNEYCTYGFKDPDYKTHRGIDISWCSGKTICAIAPGIVVAINKNCTHDYYKTKSCCNECGNYVKIYHGKIGTSDVYTRYLHMQHGSIKVNVGDKVTQHQVLGTMGCTGYSMGMHLHFDICVGGTYVDPIPYMQGTKVVPGATTNDKSSTFKPTPSTTTKCGFVKGDTVTVSTKATAYNGGKLASFVTNNKTKFTVMTTPTKDKVRIGINGVVTADVKASYLTKVKVTSTTLKVGDRIKIKIGAKATNGVKLALFVYTNTYMVLAISGNNITFGPKKGDITAIVTKTNVIKQ